MAQPSIVTLAQKSQLGLTQYVKSLCANWNKYYAMREYFLDIDRGYYREGDLTRDHIRAAFANRFGDTTKLQNVTIPLVYPQVETFTSYQASVFLTGEPIFGVVAAPQYEDAALQMEALIKHHAETFKWRAELVKFFRDCAKYSLGACEVSWNTLRVPDIITDTSYSATQGRASQILWEGNALKRLDPYNLIWDMRVDCTDIPDKGEFAGYVEAISRVEVKQLIRNLGDSVLVNNIKTAFESGADLNEYYVPQVNPYSLASMAGLLGTGGYVDTDWRSFMGLGAQKENTRYSGLYIKKTLYCRILPSEYDIKVPQKNTPQIWKLILINDVLIHAEPQTHAHDMIPIVFGNPTDDGIRYQTKSIAANVLPMQQVSSTLVNSAIASRRRAVSDRAIYNPLYMRKEDVENSNPAAKIPIKSSAYNKVALTDMYYSIPYRDDQASVIMQEIGVLDNYTNNITGQNKAQQGQFVKGNKTLHEYADVMGNSNARNQMAAIMLEDQFFSRVKFILKTNILQYQTTGAIYHEENKQIVEIDPVVLRNAHFSFKMSDGLVPTEKIINGDTWKVGLQVLGSSPQIGQEYNIGAVFKIGRAHV